VDHARLLSDGPDRRRTVQRRAGRRDRFERARSRPAEAVAKRAAVGFRRHPRQL